jgi:hypothetical protein
MPTPGRPAGRRRAGATTRRRSHALPRLPHPSRSRSRNRSGRAPIRTGRPRAGRPPGGACKRPPSADRRASNQPSSPAARTFDSIIDDDPFESTASGIPARPMSAMRSTAPALGGSSRKALRTAWRASGSGSTPNSSHATSSASRVTTSKSAHRSIAVRSQDASSCRARQRAASGPPRPEANSSHATSRGARSTSVPYRSKHTTPTRRGSPTSVKPVSRPLHRRSPPADRRPPDGPPPRTLRPQSC